MQAAPTAERRGGSGKSHLARQFGPVLGAPETHLDAVFYDDDWNPLDHETFTSLHRDLVSQPTWITDGNYNSTLRTRLESCDAAPAVWARTGDPRSQADSSAWGTTADGMAAGEVACSGSERVQVVKSSGFKQAPVSKRSCVR